MGSSTMWSLRWVPSEWNPVDGLTREDLFPFFEAAIMKTPFTKVSLQAFGDERGGVLDEVLDEIVRCVPLAELSVESLKDSMRLLHYKFAHGVGGSFPCRDPRRLTALSGRLSYFVHCLVLVLCVSRVQRSHEFNSDYESDNDKNYSKNVM